ncbi:MAG: hypothetical protein ACJZ4O_02360 [Pelagibacteraceae bacterium]
MIKDRQKKIFQRLNIEKLPFKLDLNNLDEFGRDTAINLKMILSNTDDPSMQWCMSTIKKLKVFTVIFHANENNEFIYKEEIAKKLPEYSYKTIATIVDEGIEKGYYTAMDPIYNDIKDKKIKNIRPSEELLVAFFNWSIDRISLNNKIIKKYK